jgi:hypothetical protein
MAATSSGTPMKSRAATLTPWVRSESRRPTDALSGGSARTQRQRPGPRRPPSCCRRPPAIVARATSHRRDRSARACYRTTWSRRGGPDAPWTAAPVGRYPSTPTPATLARWLLRSVTGRPIVGERSSRGRLQLPGVRLAPNSSIRATMSILRPWSRCSRFAKSGEVGRGHDDLRRPEPGRDLGNLAVYVAAGGALAHVLWEWLDGWDFDRCGTSRGAGRGHDRGQQSPPRGQSLAPITLKSLLTKMWWGQLTPMLCTSYSPLLSFTTRSTTPPG